MDVSDTGQVSPPGRTLTVLREQAGLSRERLAALAGLSPTTLYKIEHGLVEPRRATLAVLSAVLGANLAAERQLHAHAIRKALADEDSGG